MKYLPLIFFLPLLCFSQGNPYGLDILSTVSQYLENIENNPNHELVDLSKEIPDVVLDIRYATDNNFTREIIYPSAMAFARKPIAEALKKVQAELKKKGLGLKIYDAYRPYAATVKFYEVYHDTTYVANPRYGSRHNRGAAVDITLIDLNTGKELPMPTEFDDFSKNAHPDSRNTSKEEKENRDYLIHIMGLYGFSVYPHEWWHFDYKGWREFPLMDLSFEQLESL